MPTISSTDLTLLMEAILGGGRVPPHKAKVVAASLVAANLRGVDTHGAQLLPFYIDQLLAGEMDPLTDGEVVSEQGACLLFDGRNGLGQWVAEICCGHAVRIAGQIGMAIVTARESNHFGAAAWWAQKMRQAGQIGIVMCSASAIVPPWQGREGRIGTNPICMALPGPWLLDMATTTVAAGKIFKAHINHQPEIPAGWAFDSSGAPTTDTEAAFQGMLMPLGGYKGSGLGMMVEILCSVLGGGGMATEVGGIRSKGRKRRTSQTFIAIDIARFMPVEKFTARVEKLVKIMKSTPVARGYDEVLVAGEPEWRMEAERRAHGIPIAEGNWEQLVEAAGRVGVAVPAIRPVQ